MSRIRCETKNFNLLQEKLIHLEVSNLLNPDDNECPICGDSIDANSDFAVLDTCNHLMCTDCAEVTLMGQVVDMIPLDGGHIAELGKIPKCPCCRRKVGQWTTTHIMKFCVVAGCSIWDVKNTNSLLRGERLSYVDMFENCINESLLINYSSTFVWMTIHKHIKILEYYRPLFIDEYFSFIEQNIEKPLQLPRAEKSSLKYDYETKYMSGVEIVINRMVLSKIIVNDASIQQVLLRIRSKCNIYDRSSVANRKHRVDQRFKTNHFNNYIMYVFIFLLLNTFFRYTL